MARSDLDRRVKASRKESVYVCWGKGGGEVGRVRGTVSGVGVGGVTWHCRDTEIQDGRGGGG